MYHTAPSAAFTSDKTMVLTGCPVDFTDMSSGVPTSYAWIFQGAATPVSSERDPDSILYDTPGTYLVKLVVSNEAGEDSVTVSDYMTVSATSLPAVSFSADDTLICVNGIVHFIDASGFCPTAWSWAFDPPSVTFLEGTTANSKNPVVLFDAGGPYTVSLTVTNDNGDSTLVKEDYIATSVFTLPLLEEFPEAALPNCWENIDNIGNNMRWQFNNPGNRNIQTETHANGFAILDSDHYGYGNSQNADLITPSLDLSDFSMVALSFQHYFVAYQDSWATFSYSVNGGDTWNTLQTWINTTSNPEITSYDLTSQLAGQADVKLKWNYTGTWGWYWAVDDISFTGTAPGLWTGSTSSNWNSPGNWSDGIVPGGSTDITIPAFAPNWPVYNGNLTLGTQCRDITMKGASHLTINGNLTIPTGRQFNIISDGILNVSGSVLH